MNLPATNEACPQRRHLSARLRLGPGWASVASLPCVVAVVLGCKTFMLEVQTTYFLLPDSPTNRQAVVNCLTSVAGQLGLQRCYDSNAVHDLGYFSSSEGWLFGEVRRPSEGLGSYDIASLDGLAFRLTHPGSDDGVSQYIRRRLQTRTLALLSEYNGGANDTLQTVLAIELTRVIDSGESIYDPARFAGVALSAATKEALGHSPSGDETQRLNRLLLDDAFPSEVRRMRGTQLFVAYESAARWRSKQYKAAARTFELAMRAKLGDTIRPVSSAYWVP